ncbi:hypothetical protein RF55_7772 [Lasius niger]|uniref:Uncharacterized protein n=1 Tax=Lasius niger TaxID=67767 RepID=A0A0J7NID7_LASNI|nr:hypothetical protein RF55_7772 [Lasius niger]
MVKTTPNCLVGDADKVAQYFINEGPAAGHSHFIKAFNAAYDSADSANSFSGVLDGTNKPENEFHGEISLNNPISWNTCDSPLYMVPETGSCAHPAMSDVETPIIGMINPALSYPANVLYHAASPMVGSIIHPYRHGHGLPLHHTLHRTDSLPGLLHNLFNHHRWSPGYHRPLHHGRSSNDRNPVLASQSCENDDGSTAFKDFPIARSNADKPDDQNVAASIPGLVEPTHYSIQTPYIFNANAMYQPIQYRRFNAPYQYTSYHNPLINVLHPATDEYVQPGYIPQYVHGMSDPLVTAPNPNSYCTHNANAEQKDEVSTDKTAHSNNAAEQSNNANNIFKQENKTEKNENNK